MDNKQKKSEINEEEKSLIRKLAEKLLSYKNYESRIREMLDFVKKCFEKKMKKMEELVENVYEDEEYGELIKTQSIVERDIKFTNIIFELLIEIELNRKKAHSSVFHDKNEESDDMVIDGNEDE
jgi:hypothetical protein